MESSNHNKFASERIFLFFKFIYAFSTRIIFFSKCYFKANSDLLVFYKGFTVYIETFLIHFPKPQKKVIIDLKKGNYTVSGHPTLVVISALGDRSGVHYSLYVDLNNLMNRHVDVICM